VIVFRATIFKAKESGREDGNRKNLNATKLIVVTKIHPFFLTKYSSNYCNTELLISLSHSTADF
jgi:hypothetical protein